MKGSLVERIRLGWLVLSEATKPDSVGVTTHGLSDIGDEMLLALDATGTPYLLLRADEPGVEEDVGVVTIRNRELETPDGQRNFVAIGCIEPALRDAFDHFLVAVVHARARAPREHPGTTAVEVLAEWKALLQAQRPGLPPSLLAALVAELLVVRDVVLRDESRSLRVWTGPTGARHDLRRAEHAIEVKSTMSHTDRRITISGIDQLEQPLGGTLTLAWHRLEAVHDGALSVFSLADGLIAEGVSAVTLFALLDAAGSPPALRDVHDSVKFELRDRRFFVVDDHFPRLVSSSFPAGVPDGVEDVTYRVLLPVDDQALEGQPLDAVLDLLAGV